MVSYRIPVSRPHVWGSEYDEVASAIASAELSGTSAPVRQFEEEFAARHDIAHAIAVSSGTAALHLALELLGVGPNDEVIVPSFTMFSPVLAVLYRRALPVPIDADDTWNMDPAAVARAFTDRTRAVVVVHTYGFPASAALITAEAHRRGIPVVEDAAQALGAVVDGRPIGTLGDVGCFSFYANKAVTTGEGGMIVTSDPDLASQARAKRNLCFGAAGDYRYRHPAVGYNYRLSGLQAAFGRAQLRRLADATADKRRVANEYDAGLRDLQALTLPPRRLGIDPVFWAYGILINEDRSVRAAIVEKLSADGIETRPFFTPVHDQPVLAGRYEADDYPSATRLAATGILLPSFVGLESAHIAEICAVIRDELGGELR